MAYTRETAGMLLQGPFADRPAATIGKYWYLADEGGLYKSNGATWTEVIAPGGSGLIPFYAIYQGSIGGLSPLGFDDFSWDTLDTGDTLLDIATTPTLPTLYDAGVYIFHFNATPTTALTHGSHFQLGVNLGSDAASSITSGTSTSDDEVPTTSITIAYTLPTSAPIRARVFSYDPTNSLDLVLTAIIQRIT